MSFDEIPAGFLAFLPDAFVSRLPGFGTSAARLALGLGLRGRGVGVGGDRSGGDVHLGSFGGHI